jgi:hypothetical protein
MSMIEKDVMPIAKYLLALAALVSCSAVLAQEPAATAAVGKTVSCVQLNRIDSTQVLDDKTIIFRMRGNNPRYYKNTLPYKCSSLGFEKAFSYKTSTSQLCSVDIITVLQNYGGGLQPGVSCGLGKFEPYTLPAKVKK